MTFIFLNPMETNASLPEIPESNKGENSTKELSLITQPETTKSGNQISATVSQSTAAAAYSTSHSEYIFNLRVTQSINGLV